jgi:hypothetical protein
MGYFQEFHDKMNTAPECNRLYIFLEAAFEQIHLTPSKQNLKPGKNKRTVAMTFEAQVVSPQ